MWRCFIVIVVFASACVDQRKPYSVYVFMSTECPLCTEQTETLLDLKRKFGGRVRFHAVFPNEDDTPERIAAFNAKYQFDFPSQRDIDLRLAKTFGATVTPQVFLVDDEHNKLYSGQINNRMISLGKKRKVVTNHYLHDALVNALSGESIAIETTEPVGCTIFTHITICGH